MAGNERVVVTGAGGAIGRSLVRHFSAKPGCRVLGLDQQFDGITDLPASAEMRKLNLLDESAVRRAMADPFLPDGPTLLINAVGRIWSESALGFRGGKLSCHGLESWRQVIDANLTAAFVATVQAAVWMVRSRRGAIINFSSISSQGNAGQAAYSAAKAGIEGMTRALAAELGPMGVRVNAIAPGFIDVGTTREALSAARLEAYGERTPLRRLGSIEELIGAVEFLAGNSFVNGAVLALDGGLRL